MVKLKVTAIQVRCQKCGFERILYFQSGFSYGERIISTKSGEYCAYANLLEENIMQELGKIIEDILDDKRISISKNNLGQMISEVYPITCDDIQSRKVDSTPSWQCPNCLSEKIEEDKVYGERLIELEIAKVTHKAWEELDTIQKRMLVQQEVQRKGYIIC